MKTTTDTSSNLLSKLRRNCAAFLMLANLASVAGLWLMFSTPQGITSPLALILSLLWIFAISIASATVIVIVGYPEISKEIKRQQAIELDCVRAMGRDLSTISIVTTRPENPHAKPLYIYGQNSTPKSGD